MSFQGSDSPPAQVGAPVSRAMRTADSAVERSRVVGDPFDRYVRTADGSEYAGDGTIAPAAVDVIEDSGWIDITPEAGWADHTTPPRYRKINGVVHIEGMILNTSGASNGTLIFTLPVGFRPAAQQVASSYGVVQVTADGSVLPFSAVGTADAIGTFLTFVAV